MKDNKNKIEILKKIKNELLKDTPDEIKLIYLTAALLTTATLATIGISHVICKNYDENDHIIEKEADSEININGIGLFNTADIPDMRPIYEKKQSKKKNILRYEENSVKE